MYSKRTNSFELEIPQNNYINKNVKKERIEVLKSNIKEQYEELYSIQEVDITEGNKKMIEDTVLATKDLIDNCIKDNYYSGNKDENFTILTYLYHKLDLKLQTYKLEIKIKELDNKSSEIQEIQEVQENIKQRQDKAEEQSNNLVYNLLGFLASFSIVSASVETISKMQGIIHIMLFMSFTILILLTTLIALNNFYKNRNKIKSKLQDNYFLWKMMIVVIICLCIILGFKALKDNKDNVFNYIDRKINNILDEKIETYMLTKIK